MKPTYYEKIIGTLIELRQSHPRCSMGKHLATALESNTWSMTDSEIFHSLEKYKDRLSLDVNHSDEDLDSIIDQGVHLNTILIEDEED